MVPVRVPICLLVYTLLCLGDTIPGTNKSTDLCMKFQNFNHDNEIKLISDDSTLKSQYVEDIFSKLLKDTDMFYFCKSAIFLSSKLRRCHDFL